MFRSSRSNFEHWGRSCLPLRRRVPGYVCGGLYLSFRSRHENADGAYAQCRTSGPAPAVWCGRVPGEAAAFAVGAAVEGFSAEADQHSSPPSLAVGEVGFEGEDAVDVASEHVHRVPLVLISTEWGQLLVSWRLWDQDTLRVRLLVRLIPLVIIPIRQLWQWE